MRQPRKCSFVDPQPIRATTVTDPVLGALTNSKEGDWTGRILLSSTAHEIDLIIHLPAGTVPDDRERTFIQTIVQSWPSVHAGLKARAFAGLDLWDGTSGGKLFDSLRYEALWLLGCRSSPRRWELSGTSSLDDHLFTLQFEELTYVGYRMDG